MPTLRRHDAGFEDGLCCGGVEDGWRFEAVDRLDVLGGEGEAVVLGFDFTADEVGAQGVELAAETVVGVGEEADFKDAGFVFEGDKAHVLIVSRGNGAGGSLDAQQANRFINIKGQPIGGFESF